MRRTPQTLRRPRDRRGLSRVSSRNHSHRRRRWATQRRRPSRVCSIGSAVQQTQGVACRACRSTVTSPTAIACHSRHPHNLHRSTLAVTCPPPPPPHAPKRVSQTDPSRRPTAAVSSPGLTARHDTAPPALQHPRREEPPRPCVRRCQQALRWERLGDRSREAAVYAGCRRETGAGRAARAGPWDA